MFSLNGKKALVTGASGGIGQSIVKALHQQGATVVVTGTKQEVLKDMAIQFKDRIHVIAANLSQPGEIDRLISQSTELLQGDIDILVNNAGVTKDTLAIRMKDEDWSTVIDINLTTCFKLSRQVLRGMMKQRWGRIINMTSIVGVSGNAGQVNYAAAKAGLIGMTKSLALEIAARDVTVNAIAPGFIVTPMTDKLSSDQKEKLQNQIPMGKLGTPDNISPAVVFLASNEASYITGQTLHINGGMLMV